MEMAGTKTSAPGRGTLSAVAAEIVRQDEHMTRGSQMRALAWGASLAAAGAVIAYVLAGGRWAIAGVAMGAVAGAFAPSVYDAIRARDARREELRGALEKTV
jgi:hypothetical protein